jgi:multisubunit Na+/H+ antiporter MnhG subunit
MSRALVVLLVLAVLTAPAFAQSIARGRRGSHQGKTKGSKGGCAISSSVATGFLPSRRRRRAHPG